MKSIFSYKQMQKLQRNRLTYIGNKLVVSSGERKTGKGKIGLRY